MDRSLGILHRIVAFFGANFDFLPRTLHWILSRVGLKSLSTQETEHFEDCLASVLQSTDIVVGSILKCFTTLPHLVLAKLIVREGNLENFSSENFQIHLKTDDNTLKQAFFKKNLGSSKRQTKSTNSRPNKALIPKYSK